MAVNESENIRGKRVMTDEALKEDLEAGMAPVEIARKYGVGRSAVSNRLKRLRTATAIVAVTTPTHARETARQQRTALEMFLRMVQRKEEMLEAYDAQFRDEQGNLNMAPSAAQIMVQYTEEVAREDGKVKTVHKREPLDVLLAKCGEHVTVQRTTVTGADPRVEMRRLTSEISDQMVQGTDLKHMIDATRGAQAFLDALLAEVKRVDPAVGQRIAEAVRNQMMIVLPMEQSA